MAHAPGGLDPLRDIGLIETELLLADLESLERQRDAAVKRARGGDREAKERLAAIEPALALVEQGRPARALDLPGPAAGQNLAALNLLSAKPVLYVCNVDEESAAAGNEMSRAVAAHAAASGAEQVAVSAAIEAEIAPLDGCGGAGCVPGGARAGCARARPRDRGRPPPPRPDPLPHRDRDRGAGLADRPGQHGGGRGRAHPQRFRPRFSSAPKPSRRAS